MAAAAREDHHTDLAEILGAAAAGHHTDLVEIRDADAAGLLSRVDADHTDLSRVQARDREPDAAAVPPAALSGYAMTSSPHIKGL